MRATVKRILAIILILTMVQFPGIRVEAEEIIDNQNTGRIEETFINPLYDDVISEEDLVSADESSFIEAYAEEEYSSSIEECAAQLREGMKQRIESIKVYYQVPEYEGGYAKQLLDLAMMHTGNPSEGDYIKWQYGGCKASTSYFTDDTGMCCMTITFTCTYYTTGEQESVLDERINEVLAELNVYEADDYEKVRAIYDYVCTHVEYDYENDDDYKLKYTAYAALINGKAVCQGYALLFYRMTLELGVDNRLIPGTGNNGAHGWNIVKLGKYYYNADTTWDCNKEEYQYFLKCDENFRNHTRDKEYSTEEFYSVYPMAGKDYKRAEKIELDRSSCEINIGESFQLTAVCAPAPESQSEIEWRSDNEEVAAVDENGIVTGNSKGTAVITACYGDKEAKCNVNVKNICPSTEHDYKAEWDWTEAEGEVPYKAILTLTCSKCEDRQTVVGEVKLESKKEVTCTEDGENIYSATAEYGEKAYNSEKTVVNKATGHKFGEWEVKIEPTESKEGLEIRTCEVCKAQEERTIGKKSNVSVLYKTHIQTYGTEPEWKSNGELSGTSGEGKRLESIRIKLDNNGVYEGGIEYSTHVQREGWQDWKENGAMSGTEGSGLRLEAIKIRLTGDLAEHYDVYYAVHAQYYGWLNWAKNGEVAGTAGQSKRLEAIKIILVAKGGDAPEKIGTEDRCYVHYYVGYRTHVQTYGWQDYVYDGAMSGTSGESKRLEAINIKLMNQEYDGDIEYQTHVQTYGWEPKWSKNGALSGTSGEGKRLEAIRIRLTDEMAEKYDVYYRVHAQYYGWLGWAKNGEEAGTAGFGKRLEGIEIVLVEKDGKAPENSGEKKAFISQ